MASEIGKSLDKYELLERVGQGGMAVVYRGRDTSLRREVAVKVLHSHLADHKEARDRFEREAHAVAKLRHENILEIYDFSGTESDESYIVTEFIDGESLKEFITQHEIKYPEIGSMIALLVCRALSHAHGAGILHRDVKPENVMISKTGVVKLTDFGIAQMVDLQRLTVTGQLLGSPAYMSPEHVTGGQLDFRTDVFAVGILLYQLCCGELPFKGKNPHEILKKIADCQYIPPAVVNPLVGRELSKIIKTALAQHKEDRFADVTEMMVALETFLRGSGIEDFKEELHRFFSSPVSYEMALRPRLIEHLSGKGRELLPIEKPRALEAFNRVLTLDPDNADVLAEIDRIGRRKRLSRIGLVVTAAVAVALLGFLSRDRLRGGEEVPLLAGTTILDPAQVTVPDAGAAAADATRVAAITPDANTGAAATADAATEGATNGSAATNGKPDDNGTKPPARVDAGNTTAARRTFSLVVAPANSEYRVSGGPWSRMAGRSAQVTVGDAATTVEVRNDCCVPKSFTIERDRQPGRIGFALSYKPAQVIAKCSRPNIAVRVNGRQARLGRAAPVFIKGLLGTQKAHVEFFDNSGGGIDPTKPKKFYKKKTLEVKYGTDTVVTCD